MDHRAIASSSVLGLKIAFLDKIVIFRPNIELEAIARQSVEASREVDCAYFGNIGRNSGYFLLLIFLGSYLSVPACWEGGGLRWERYFSGGTRFGLLATTVGF